MCVGPQRAFCGPRSSSETRTRTQRHVRHTLDTRRQKSQVSQSGQLLLICVLREGKRRSACCNCRNNSRRFFVFSNIGRRRERTILNGASLPELLGIHSQFPAVLVRCCLQQLLKKSSTAHTTAFVFEFSVFWDLQVWTHAPCMHVSLCETSFVRGLNVVVCAL